MGDPVDEQEAGRPDVPPRQRVPGPDVHEGVPAHRQVRGVEMADVGDGEANQVVADHLGLGGGVQHAHAEQEHERVEIGQLVGECDAAGVGTGRVRVRCLTTDEALQVV